MDHFIDFNARGALEDRQLQDSWKAAQSEYNRYHSLKRAGDDWVQLLTADEMKQVKRAMGLPVVENDSVADVSANTMKWEVVSPKKSLEKVNGASASIDGPTSAVAGSNGIQRDASLASAGELQSQSCQDVLGSIQDQATRDLVTSWYYAGYYTGYFEGQRNAASKTDAS